MRDDLSRLAERALGFCEGDAQVTAWWERQLGLSLIGMMVVFGWEKAVGDPDELAWWEQHALAAAHWLEP